MKRLLLLVAFSLLVTAATATQAARAVISTLSSEPYLSALVINAADGKILFEDNSNAKAYPASVLKMMVLLVVLEKVEKNELQLDEMVQVTTEAARMGGSQVYLDPREQFPVEDLLYALMVQSANDAAVALAIHVSGSKDAFIRLMNERAVALGMKDTAFFSVHGLPPSKGQRVDITTAKDLSILARELAGKNETFKYTAAREREFRNGDFIMRTHNHLLKSVVGCDGFKTGYFAAAGFSIVATAKRNGVRLIVIVLGSKDRKVRDAKAIALFNTGFSKALSAKTEKTIVEPVSSETPVTPATSQVEDKIGVRKPTHDEKQAPQQEEKESTLRDNCWAMFLFGIGVGLLPFLLLVIGRRKSRRRSNKYM